MVTAGLNAPVDPNIGVYMEQPDFCLCKIVKSCYNTVLRGFTMEIHGEFQVEHAILTKQLLRQQLVKLMKKLASR